VLERRKLKGGTAVKNWSQYELQRLAETDDLHISPLREDNVTYGTPTWIWSVVVGDKLYVRAYNGQASRWYKAAMRQKKGRITAAGMTKDVVFQRGNIEAQGAIDVAYRTKYSNSPYLKPMVESQAQSATVLISPC
jgi:hypothetical protein